MCSRESGGNARIDPICLQPVEFGEGRHRITLVSTVLPEAIDLLPQGRSWTA